MVIVILAVILDFAWKHVRGPRAPATDPAHDIAASVDETGGEPSPTEHGGPAPSAP